jgi:electron transfer flavoprotein alpha subunit
VSQDVLIHAERFGATFRKVAYELVSEGRRLADKLEGDVIVVVMGNGSSSDVNELTTYGADLILTVSDPVLEKYSAEVYADIFCTILKDRDPEIVLFGATAQGRDISARVAAQLQAGLAMECTAVSLKNGLLMAKKPLYGGKIIAEVVVEGKPKMAAVRPNLLEITKKTGNGIVEPVTVDVNEPKVKVLKISVDTTPKLDLAEANVIVSGGSGMGGPDFTILENLAELLDGAVGASRNAVDKGWRPQSEQVGQTGKVVSPKLYVACGISGAMQHLAGMSSSDTIVAINSDPDALIFKIADFCIIDDLFEVVPAITEEIRKLLVS